LIKFYLPYGTLPGRGNPAGAIVHWFVHDRQEPVTAYAQLIENYKQLSEPNQRRAERMVDELFTQSEFDALRAYLYEKYRMDLRTTLLVAPINGIKQDNLENRSLVRPFAECAEGEQGSFCRLCEMEGYSLPFRVWGYYTSPVYTRPVAASLGATAANTPVIITSTSPA
jgi:hypothetical protein